MKPEETPKKGKLRKIAGAGLALIGAAGIYALSEGAGSSEKVAQSKPTGPALVARDASAGIKKVMAQVDLRKAKSTDSESELNEEENTPPTGDGSEPKEPEKIEITIENAAELARQGNREACRFIVKMMDNITTGSEYLNAVEEFKMKFGIDEMEYIVLYEVKRINDFRERLLGEDKSTGTFSDTDSAFALMYGIFGGLARTENPFHPLLLAQLGMDKVQLRDFVREIIAYVSPLLPVAFASKEGIESLRIGYNL